jgi:SPP1 gp7 family putative phage head morphogenesis protein
MTWERALEADARLAARNAVKIRAALAQSFDAKQVFEQYLATQPAVSDKPAQDRARARAWVMLNIRVNMEALKEVMIRVWAEGYVTGEAFADEQIRMAREIKKADDGSYVDWSNWKPGDRASALLLRPPKAFQQLLGSQGITFKDFSDTTVRDIGNAIADAVELGMSAERSAKNIRNYVASPARALSIAITEQNRAISYATINRYKESAIEQIEWQTSSPCDKCAQNQGQVIQMGGTFNSGATQPPQHPHCRCVLLPVIPDFAEPPMTGATLVTPPTPEPYVPPALQGTGFVHPLDKIKNFEENFPRLKAMEDRGFVAGEWTKLTREEIKESSILTAMRLRPNWGRKDIESIFEGSRMSRADKALLEKGTVYRNGKIEVQFYFGGSKVPEADRLAILKIIDELQATNPKERAIIHIEKESSTKYGWAYGGGEHIWITPKVAMTGQPPVGAGEGTFKMPVRNKISQREYTLSHEWGHLIDNIDEGIQDATQKMAIEALKKDFPEAFRSKYSLENTKEFYAEMFAEYFNTGGLTDNPLVLAMAERFKWKAPAKAARVIYYTKAKNSPSYYLDDIEAAEARLKGYIPTKIREKDGVAIPDWSAASGGSGPENIQLKNLMRDQGFLGKPRIVTPDEFQKIVDQGAIPVYRGMGAQTQKEVDEYTARLLTGDDPFIGRGFFGDGTYFATDRGIAERFSAQDASGEIDFKFGKVLDGVLDPQAKVIDIEDLWKLRDEYVEKMPYHGELAQAYEDDIGLFATTQGYDAIINKNPMIGYTPDGQRRYAPGSYYTVLNRSALIMKGTP